jgi:hypothetical protein
MEFLEVVARDAVPVGTVSWGEDRLPSSCIDHVTSHHFAVQEFLKANYVNGLVLFCNRFKVKKIRKGELVLLRLFTLEAI